MNLRQLVERGDRPFASQPQVGRYFPAASIDDARQRLCRAVERGDGPGVAIGGPGSGKSLLLQVLAAQFHDKFDIVLLACAQLCTRRALLQAIHFELGLDYQSRDEGQLRLSLLDHLLSSNGATQGLLLLVDEAQSMPPRLLEELRVLTNLARGGQTWVKLVLAGLPSLEEKLAGPELSSFAQRLATRCYIGPFTREETRQYISAQLAACGADPAQVFDSAALNAVFTASDGVPRLVNQICDRSLWLADSRQSPCVDAALVQDAWADLQQLPTPWEMPRENESAASATSNVVEFGSLASEPAAIETPASQERLAPRPKPAEQTPLTIDVGRLARRMASMPFLGEEPEVDEANELTELDEEVIASPPRTTSAASHRHRPLSDAVPEAVDPFAVPFEEEELVLDNFAALSGLFGTRTPRVENRRDPSFTHRVERAMREEAPAPPVPESKPRKSKHSDPKPTREQQRPRIRLAVMSDTPAQESSEVEPRMQKLVAEAEELDFGPAARRTTLAVDSQPASRAAAATNQSHEVHANDDVDAAHDNGGAILVIEDDAVTETPPAEVRREGYRQLFSRLRHGA